MKIINDGGRTLSLKKYDKLGRSCGKLSSAYMNIFNNQGLARNFVMIGFNDSRISFISSYFFWGGGDTEAGIAIFSGL